MGFAENQDFVTNQEKVENTRRQMDGFFVCLFVFAIVLTSNNY